MDFNQLVLNAFNKTYTDKGARALKTTNDALIDFLFSAGAMRDSNAIEIVKLFDKALAENKDKAMKLLFYIRDCREGMGERRFFRECLKSLIRSGYTKTFIKNMDNIIEFGRYDDLFIVFEDEFDHMFGIQKFVCDFLFKQLEEDLTAEYPTLLAKWLPTEKSGVKACHIAKKIITLQYNFYTDAASADYRRKVSKVRKKLNIIEHQITEKSYFAIDYSKVPSMAMKRYQPLFYKYDEDRFIEYLNSVRKGEKKLNASLLTPVDIVQDIINSKKSDYYNEAWNNLKDFRNDENEGALVVCDTSGSMTINQNRPLATAIGLSIYIAERNHDVFKNKFITFSHKPSLNKIIGDNIVEKVENLEKAEWAMNTNIDLVFDIILSTAIRYRVSQKDMIKKVFIISDMEFDDADDEADDTLFEYWRRQFINVGYSLPHIVYWNVAGSTKHFPASKYDDVTLVSGSSAASLQFALNGAESVIRQICNKERYSKICF